MVRRRAAIFRPGNTRAVCASPLIILALSTPSTPLSADETSSRAAVRLAADFRYRAEAVEQAGFARDALASTLRSRLTLSGEPAEAWSWVVEVDDVRVLGAERYNSTHNGEIRYPVVADPRGTDVNRAAVAWRHGALTLRAGRQRIVHGNERFLGGVAWRQNEQTYDGLRAQWETSERLSLDAGYIRSVRRIFGPDHGIQPARWDGDSLFLRATWRPTAGVEIRPFAYRLDIDPDAGFGSALTVDNSTDTLGAEVDWSVGDLTLRGAYARQWDQGESTLDYAANYSLLQANYDFGGVQLELRREVLGSDSGVGFRTPLSTLHKFQGWADVFLNTPGDGIEDSSIALEGGGQAISWRLVAHQFTADTGGDDYGREFDLDVNWRVSQRVTLQFRFAHFEADRTQGDAFRDVQKAWFIARLALP